MEHHLIHQLAWMPGDKNHQNHLSTGKNERENIPVNKTLVIESEQWNHETKSRGSKKPLSRQ